MKTLLTMLVALVLLTGSVFAQMTTTTSTSGSTPVSFVNEGDSCTSEYTVSSGGVSSPFDYYENRVVVLMTILNYDGTTTLMQLPCGTNYFPNNGGGQVFYTVPEWSGESATVHVKWHWTLFINGVPNQSNTEFDSIAVF